MAPPPENNEDVAAEERELQQPYDEEQAVVEEDRSTTGENSSSRVGIARRRTVLLQVLFGHMLQHQRRQRQQQQQRDSQNIQPPHGPLQTLSHEEAQAMSATCRYCFEGSSSSDHPQKLLVSPCNCSGHSKWVHLTCLRQWQRHQQSGSTEARICRVCRSPYQVSPPIPPRLRQNLLKRGTLLVYKDDADVTSIFYKAVVLLVESGSSQTGPYGLILNSPLLLQEQQEVNMDRPNMEWRNGGPVCSGRLGVTKYLLAHTLPTTQTPFENNNYSSLDVFSQQDSNDGEEGASAEGESIQNHGGGFHVIVSSSLDGQSLVPALMDRQQISHMVDQLDNSSEQEQQQQQQQQRFVVFAGYCKWHCGQLEGEVQRGSWLLCNNATAQDVWRDNLWQDLMDTNNNENNNGNSRLLTHQEMFEDETNNNL